MFSVPAATTTAPARTVWRSPAASTYSTPVAAPSSISTRSTAEFGAELEQAARPRVVDVGVHRRLARVRRAALEARAAAHAVRVRVGGDGLELDAERAEAGLDRADALRPVAALAHAEHLLDPVVPGCEVGGGEGLAAVVREPARRMPLRDVALVGAQRDLRVDRGRPADAAAGEQREHLAAGKRREPQRPPHVVRRLRLPAHEVRRREVRARPRAGGRRGRAARARPRPRRRPRRSPRRRRRTRPSCDPQVGPVLVQARRERRVEVDLGPRARALAPRRDEVAVVRLARERADEAELRRAARARRARRRRPPPPARARRSPSSACARTSGGIPASSAST